ncbi:MAG: fasciclin domain-containing protein [Acidobacteria bacterium]|nr:MAG: fasciclin domain-containing protein [Acidobacteriota bacterium]
MVGGFALAAMHEKGAKKANIVQTAQQAGQFKTLLTALKEAGLEDTLATKCCFTVFAPTDEAFGKVPKDKLDALLKDKEALRKVLLYHVVEGKVYSKDLKEGQKVKTLQGQEATITLKGGAKINNANITKTDIEASNGVIHVIDTVIMPK